MKFILLLKQSVFIVKDLTFFMITFIIIKIINYFYD